MGMSSLKLLKYVLFIFNLLFWVCGCCILGFGIYLLVQNTYGVLFRNLPFLTLGNVLVIVGSIIMVVAFLGCMGSIKENKCLLMSVSPCSSCDSLSWGRWCLKSRVTHFMLGYFWMTYTIKEQRGQE
ncbi:leukocyte surface antigen CD53-like, partial [Peromyscus leucopus]|uniref:leukocyte surface antigen CD53-like n=1 Tax=Peromyscus leucopus TaxID=10041 RepID=UPI0018851AA4